MDKEHVQKIIHEVMGIDPKKFPESKELHTISEWDSFNNLMLISRLQEEYNVEFTAAEIEKTKTIGQIYALVAGKHK